MDRYSFLQQFHPITIAEYILLSDKLKECFFTRGTILIQPGEIPKGLYFVESGVQMSYSEHDSRMKVIAFTYNPGLCTIPAAFALQQPSDYTLMCLTDSKLSYISYHDLIQVLDQSRNLERLFRNMTEMVLGNFISRHVELRTLTIRERYLSFCRRSPHLLNRIPHKYIASYLDIDPTNFSKLFNAVTF